MVRFRTVKIGGKQDYGVKGIQDLRMYMEEAKVNQFKKMLLKVPMYSENIF